MKQFEYKEITLGGLTDNNDRAEALSAWGKKGYKVISVFTIQHGPNSNMHELRAILEKEIETEYPITGAQLIAD